MFSLLKLLFDLLFSNDENEARIDDEPTEPLNPQQEETRTIIATVTEISGNDGLLDHEIYFNYSCMYGRNRPKLGDKVQASMSRRSPNSGWCATQMTCCDDNTWDNDEATKNSRPGIFNKKRSALTDRQLNDRIGVKNSLSTANSGDTRVNRIVNPGNASALGESNDETQASVRVRRISGENDIDKSHDVNENNDKLTSKKDEYTNSEIHFGYITHMLCSSERGSIKTIKNLEIYEFVLSDCADWYLPQPWDCVKFYLNTKFNFTTAVNITPTRIYQFEGKVRVVQRDHGYVDGDIFFSHNVCVNKVLPAKYSMVSGVAVERRLSKSIWRAVTLYDSKQGDIPEMRLPHNRRGNQKRGHGIMVSNDYTTDPIVEVGQKTDINVIVRNLGTKIQNLTDIRLDEHNCERPESFSIKKVQLSTDSAALNEVNRVVWQQEKITLFPGTSLTAVLQCQPLKPGCATVEFTFQFTDLSIGHRVQVSATEPLYQHLIPVTQGYHRSRSNGQGHRHSRNWVVPGEKPLGFLSKAVLPYDVPTYPVPDYLYDVVTDSQKLVEVEPELLKPLNIDNYKKKMRLLLHLEEIQGQMDMVEFDMKRVFLRVCGPYLGLKVEGLAEGRPSVLVGDKIVVSEPGCDEGPCYEGYVHEVMAEEILLKFHVNFHQNFNGQDYDVRFIMSRTNMRRCQQSIDLAYDLGQAVLFPTSFHAKEPQWKQPTNHHHRNNKLPIQQPMRFHNTSLNERQKCAVSRILLGQSRPTPYIIYGPPGTGKTVTVVEAILQIFLQIPSSRILACSPSNSSADLIALRLHEMGQVTPADMVRINAVQRNIESVPEKIHPYCSTDELKVASIYRIIVCTCSSAGMLYPLGIRAGHFTHVFVDEAGQATEPESFIALCLASGISSQLILTGDPMQLGPVLRSHEAKQYGLQESYLERVTRIPIYRRDMDAYPAEGYNPHLVTKLLDSYRAHHTLLKLPSMLFYHNELVAKADSTVTDCLLRWEKLPNKDGFPLIFHGVMSEDLRDGNSPSWFNPGEVVVVVQYVQSLLSANLDVEVSDIAVITPYRKQVEKLRLLMDKLGIQGVKVGSVEEFQGQERKVVIISTVRSKVDMIRFDQIHNLGFLSNPKRFNVAISRAMACLIVVGNPHVLTQDENWYSLINYCKQHNAYVGCDLPDSLNA